MHDIDEIRQILSSDGSHHIILKYVGEELGGRGVGMGGGVCVVQEEIVHIIF